jgi:nitrogen-specific signal transduction histidine kinase/PAS domain-containing protein
MAKFHTKTIKHRFVVGLSVIMAVLGIFFAVIISMNLRHQLVTDTEHKASLVLSQAEAVQAYVREMLRPAMYDLLPPDGFLLEAMSTSYVTRKVMSDLNARGDQFRYRRVAQGARNPDYEADAFERGLIARFEEDPTLTRLEEMTTREGEEVFVAARPVRFEASCLHCHGDPAVAPKALLERYGNTRGFWCHDGELVGLDLVTMPVAGALGHIKGATVGFLSLFALGLAVFYLTIQVFFDRLVVVNLRRTTAVMRRYFPEEAGETPPASPDASEIEELHAGIEAFASRLREAHSNIEDHAQNLERKVATRTAALAHEADERRSDVALFVDLLNILNLSQTRAELLASALARIAGRFGAVQAAYECEFAGGGSVIWPSDASPPPPPDDWRKLVAEDLCRLEARTALIPVRTTEISRGLLRLYFPDDGPGPDSGATDLYRAVGQQLGIALENLDAISSLLNQNMLLASIFEGISDPLFLLDGTLHVILANDAARELVRALRAGQNEADVPVPGAAPQTVPRTGKHAHLPPELLGADSLENGLATLSDTLVLGETSFSTVSLPGGRTFAVTRYPWSALGQPERMVVYARENTAERRMLERMRQSESSSPWQAGRRPGPRDQQPPGVIACYAELLRSQISDPQALDDLAVIERHAVQTKKVLRDLLDFARPRPSDTGPCDVGAVLASLSRIFEVQAQARQVRLATRLPGDLAMARADAAALEQVVSNLVLNALDAVRSGEGVIELAAGPGDDGETVWVRGADNGPGIPDEDLPHIFEPFFTTKEAGHGSGLGLAVVYGLVRDMGGDVTVENEGGAVFTVTLPACRDECLEMPHD